MDPNVLSPEEYTGRCPHCGSENEAAYGTVDVAPIWLQTLDIQFGVKREYMAERHFCNGCHNLFDVRRVNRLLSSQGEG